MQLDVDAIYENGVLRPEHPLELTEGQRVRVRLIPIAEQMRSLLHWSGDHETLRRIAEDPIGDMFDEPVTR